MKIQLSLTPQLSQKLEQRLALEQRFHQRPEQHIALSQYLDQEDFMKGLITWCDDNHRWKSFDKCGFRFTYGHIPAEKSPLQIPGFAHCFYDPFDAGSGSFARGEWVLFVVEDLTPKEFEPYVAIHERGEALSGGDHFFASKLEFAAVQRSRKTRNYIAWIDADYPTKFVDLTEPACHVLPDELREELEGKEHKEIFLAQDLIDQFPLPTTVLERVVKYDQINTNYERLLDDAVDTAYQLISTARSLEEASSAVNDSLKRTIRSIDPQAQRILVPRRISQAWQTPLKIIKEHFHAMTGRNIHVPYDFTSLYDAVTRGEKIVTLST